MENCQQETSSLVSRGLNVILNSLIAIICMQTTYITNIESLLQKIILWNILGLYNPNVFFQEVIEQLLIHYFL